MWSKLKELGSQMCSVLRLVMSFNVVLLKNIQCYFWGQIFFFFFRLGSFPKGVSYFMLSFNMPARCNLQSCLQMPLLFCWKHGANFQVLSLLCLFKNMKQLFRVKFPLQRRTGFLHAFYCVHECHRERN